MRSLPITKTLEEQFNLGNPKATGQEEDNQGLACRVLETPGCSGWGPPRELGANRLIFLKIGGFWVFEEKIGGF